MARADGISPSQLFFNRLPRQKLPIHADPTPINISNRSRSKRHAQNIANRNTHAQEIASLPLGARVWIQHHETKKWDRQTKIIEIRQDGRSYLLETANCTHLLRKFCPTHFSINTPSSGNKNFFYFMSSPILILFSRIRNLKYHKFCPPHYSFDIPSSDLAFRIIQAFSYQNYQNLPSKARYINLKV